MLRWLLLSTFCILLIQGNARAQNDEMQAVDIGIHQSGEGIYITILNTGDKAARIGPMTYSSIMNDVAIFGSAKENLRLRNPALMMPGKEEMKQWNAESFLLPNQFSRILVPMEYFRDKYKESGCHEIKFAYVYHHLKGSTQSENPEAMTVCW